MSNDSIAELHRLSGHHGPAANCQACADVVEAAREWRLAFRRHRRHHAKRVNQITGRRAG